MTPFQSATAAFTVLLLSACGDSDAEFVSGSGDEAGLSEAEEFAARINGNAASASAGEQAGAPAQTTAAQVAGSPIAGAAQSGSECGAGAMAPFIGKQADDKTRIAIAKAAGGNAVAVVAFGTEPAGSDPANPRLNLMLDQGGVIRDARCE